jgi:hypothetical protein
VLRPCSLHSRHDHAASLPLFHSQGHVAGNILLTPRRNVKGTTTCDLPPPHPAVSAPWFEQVCSLSVPPNNAPLPHRSKTSPLPSIGTWSLKANMLPPFGAATKRDRPGVHGPIGARHSESNPYPTSAKRDRPGGHQLIGACHSKSNPTPLQQNVTGQEVMTHWRSSLEVKPRPHLSKA